MENTARLFNCARCHIQVFICRSCDRGNVYCSTCSPKARADSIRKASRRYQNTLRGKHNHAERQRRYRQKKVTHQGSKNNALYDELMHEPNAEEVQTIPVVSDKVCCHFCGKSCTSFLRLGFLRYGLSKSHTFRSSLWPLGP
jgi:uncharacterized lipoprotein YehR (DUF1307 family)